MDEYQVHISALKYMDGSRSQETLLLSAMSAAAETSQRIKDPSADFMNSHSRIAARYVFESRILIRFCRSGQKLAVQGWARDLSESGLGGFVAEDLAMGETVTLQVPFGDFGKQTIDAKVCRQVGTQYGFQFTALSAEQRSAIQAAVRGQTTIRSWAWTTNDSKMIVCWHLRRFYAWLLRVNGSEFSPNLAGMLEVTPLLSSRAGSPRSATGGSGSPADRKQAGIWFLDSQPE